jgi:hypothetical protein
MGKPSSGDLKLESRNELGGCGKWQLSLRKNRGKHATTVTAPSTEPFQ